MGWRGRLVLYALGCLCLGPAMACSEGAVPKLLQLVRRKPCLCGGRQGAGGPCVPSFPRLCPTEGCSLSHSSSPAASALGQAGVPSLSSLVLLTGQRQESWQAGPSIPAFSSTPRPDMPTLLLPPPAPRGRGCYAEVEPKSECSP